MLHLRYSRFLQISFCLIFISSFGFGQVSIVGVPFSGADVSAETLVNIGLSSTDADGSATIVVKLLSARNEELMKVISTSFKIPKGFSFSSQLGAKPLDIQFANTRISEFIKTFHQLPSGKYTCEVLLQLENGESISSSEIIESEFSSFLNLILPSNGDTITEKYPLFIWTCNEIFSLLQQNEYYRMVLVESREGQLAEEAIQNNSPILVKDYLSKFEIQYPFDAPELIDGKHYAWQILKMTGSVISNRSDVWTFFKFNPREKGNVNCVGVGRDLNTTPYIVTKPILQFYFIEDYFTDGENIQAEIIGYEGREIKIKIVDEVSDSKQPPAKLSKNRYEINFSDLNLHPGIYTLKILNGKGQIYQLNFKIK